MAVSGREGIVNGCLQLCMHAHPLKHLRSAFLATKSLSWPSLMQRLPATPFLSLPSPPFALYLALHACPPASHHNPCSMFLAT